MKFNTINGGLTCPFCKEKIISGVGFRFGKIDNRQYEIGDEIDWSGSPTRPDQKPDATSVKTIGYFNCDNVKCKSWQDCYPEVQTAQVSIENNKIKSIEIYTGPDLDREYKIVEPAELGDS